MSLYYFCTVLFFCQILTTIFGVEISCNIRNLSYRSEYYKNATLRLVGKLKVSFEKKNLVIDVYNSTGLSNFRLSNVSINYDGIPFTINTSDENVSLSMMTKVEGITELQTANNFTQFTNCVIDVKRLITYSTYFLSALQNKLIDLARPCIQTELCSELSRLKLSDSVKFKKTHYDYGRNSALYKTLSDKYPNINFINPMSRNEADFQKSMNVFADFWFALIVKQLEETTDGRIIVPEMREIIPGLPYIGSGSFNVSRGFFGNLRDFSRLGNLKVVNDGLKFSAESLYIFPQVNILFTEYSLERGLISSKGVLKIKIKSLILKFSASLDYNQEPCVAQAHMSLSKLAKPDYEWSENTIFDRTLKLTIDDYGSKFTNSSIDFVLSKINNYFIEQLVQWNCEKLRP